MRKQQSRSNFCRQPRFAMRQADMEAINFYITRLYRFKYVQTSWPPTESMRALLTQTKHIQSIKNLRTPMKWGTALAFYSKGWMTDTATCQNPRNITEGINGSIRNAKHGIIRTKTDSLPLVLRQGRSTIRALQGRNIIRMIELFINWIGTTLSRRKKGKEACTPKCRSFRLEI